LIVEDDFGMQRQLRWVFDDYEVLSAASRGEALTQLRRFEPHVVLQDLGLPPEDSGVEEGLRTIQEILAGAPYTKVIVITGNHQRESALRAIELGACDFCEKPMDYDALSLIVKRAFHVYSLEDELRRLREGQARSPMPGLVATDALMLKACRTIESVARANVSVLISGESGTGKDLLARALHAQSGRSAERLVTINCAAIPEQLLEIELFGCERGAVAGLPGQTLGKVEQAHGGTLFLDEIGDMPLAIQAKLLRLLEKRVIERVGGREEIAVDVRVVCATHRDLPELIAAQRFREDLYFRIAEVVVTVPPLRDRHGAPTVLAHAVLQKHNGPLGKTRRGFTPDALSALESYSWPGNVRELENKVRSAILLAEGRLISAADLGLHEGEDGAMAFNLKEVRTRAERQAIQQALATTGGNVSRCADLLGVSRPTLYDLMEKYAIRPG
jgi:two-component system NtrC family response regulator